VAVPAILLALALRAAPPSDPAAALARDLAALRRNSAAVAPETDAARALAAELGRIGKGYLDLGETGRAVELLEEAYGWDEENGLVLAALTLAYVRQENFSFARFYLELAERRAPRAPPDVYASLGEIYEALNRLDDAVLAWEQFERLAGGDPRILRRLARARAELSLTRGQRVLQSPDFSIFSDEGIALDDVERVASRLAESYRAQSAFFGRRFDAPQVVVLYGGREYFSLVSIPDWVGGVFDGKIRVSMDPGQGVTPALEGVLSHELAHALVRSVSSDRAPGWLHEGIAQWLEGKRISARELHEAFSSGRKPASLSEMDGSLGRRSDRATARALYAEALGLVEYLIQTHGSGAVVCVLRDLADGRTVAEALRAQAGATPEELVAAWRRWAGL
jgi:tetratricopeptide (TPR) repeat protein